MVFPVIVLPQASARFVAGIHVFLACQKQDVDGRDKPGHDDMIGQRRQKRYKGSTPIAGP
jgi:hypothetical protein